MHVYTHTELYELKSMNLRDVSIKLAKEIWRYASGK